MRSCGACLVVVVATTSMACGPESHLASEAGGAGGTSAGTGGSAAGTGGATGGTGGGAAGSGGATGGTGGSAAGTGGAGGTAGTPGEVVPPYGMVQFGTLFHFPVQGSAQALGVAAFYRESIRYPGTPCTTTPLGQCSITTCAIDANPPEPVPEPEPDPRPAPTAGAITIRTSGDFTADLTPDGTGIYGMSAQAGILRGEETATVTAAGADVPAFTVTMTYPLLLLLTQPAFDDVQTVYSVSRSADLVLSWDRGIEGSTLQVQSAGGPGRLFCSAPAEAGTLTIDRAALRELDSGTELILLGVTSQVVTAGDYAVTVAAAGSVMTPDRTRRAAIVLE